MYVEIIHVYIQHLIKTFVSLSLIQLRENYHKAECTILLRHCLSQYCETYIADLIQSFLHTGFFNRAVREQQQSPAR